MLPWLYRMLRFQQLKCHRSGTGLAVLELPFRLGKMVAVCRNPGLLKIHDDKPCCPECLPVVRQRTMKPDELRREVCPGGINTFLGLEVREIPAIRDLIAVLRHGSPFLRKAGMGEHEYCHPVWFQDTMESVQGAVQVRGIH